MITKNKTSKPYYIGVGASAGGLEAIEAFFSNMPVDTGMIFILIQHLSPDYKSLMVELLAKRTQMPVYQAKEGMQVEPNSVYLIPPKKNLTVFHGKLLLSEQDRSKINLPIDIFLHSLAEDQGNRAVAVILSGTGSDGMRGSRAIKEADGIIMVQDEESAKFDGMPKSVISTGMADYILPPDEMAEHLINYVKIPHTTRSALSKTLLTDEDGMTRIFYLLRKKTKVDFTHYKPSTLVRRIERRMTINQFVDLHDYVRFLEQTSREQTTLYKEMLIGVTRFFRDDQVFDQLREKWLPYLLERTTNQEIRIWVAGCSTGEEVYSLAILCRETMQKIGKAVDVKIFATDIDNEAILKAGSGLYPESIAADISPELLAKYFYHKNNQFQITRSIREMVVFARHNLVENPPFNNVDLVTCRNLLIYLQPVLQRKAMEMFNFSLNAGGILVLGTSETPGEMADYFEPLSHKWKIYRSLGKYKDTGIIQARSFQNKIIPQRQRIGTRVLSSHEEERILDRFLQALAGDYVPLAIVVNEQLELLHVLGDTSGYFKLPSGKMSNDISKMAVKELSIPLTTGIQKVFRTMEEVKFTKIRLSQQYASKYIQLRIKPLPTKRNQEPLVAVFLQEMEMLGMADVEQTKNGQEYDVNRETEQRLYDLEQELQFTKENLQATIEELETSNEELQATNEELLASNEELQSTNEELQSVNEELFTVNAEYQQKILELTELTSDMDNLLASIEIATLFLDETLAIRKFTPLVTDIFNIMDADINRPLSHINHKIQTLHPMDIIAQVNDNKVVEEQDFQTVDGRWFRMRVIPYHVGPDIYSGVVLTFIDISNLKKTQQELERNQDSLRTVLESTADGILAVDEQGYIRHLNRRFIEMWHIPTELLNPNKTTQLYNIMLEQLINPKTAPFKSQQLYNNIEKTFDILKLKDGRIFEQFSFPINRNGEYEGTVWSFRDITERKQAEQMIQSSVEQWEATFDALQDMVSIIDTDFRIQRVNRAMADYIGLNKAEIIGKKCHESFCDVLPESCPHRKLLIDGQTHTTIVDNGHKKYEIHVIPIKDKGGQASGCVHIAKEVE